MCGHAVAPSCSHPDGARIGEGTHVGRENGILVGITERKRWCFSLIGAVSLVLALAGCDTFFEFDLLATDCVAREPLQGVAAVTHLDAGYGEEDHHGTTDAAGKIFITLNEPDGVTVTLTLSKAGYQTWTKQFRGEPAKPYPVCLQPALP